MCLLCMGSLVQVQAIHVTRSQGITTPLILPGKCLWESRCFCPLLSLANWILYLKHEGILEQGISVTHALLLVSWNPNLETFNRNILVLWTGDGVYRTLIVTDSFHERFFSLYSISYFSNFQEIFLIIKEDL